MLTTPSSGQHCRAGQFFGAVKTGGGFIVDKTLTLHDNMNKSRANNINRSINDKTYFKNISKMLISSSYKIDEVIKVVIRHNKLIKKLSEDTKWIHDNQKFKK